MNENDVQRIVGQMTNFYGDHLPIDSSFVRMLGIYGKIFTTMHSEVNSVKNNSLIDTTETLHTLPYFKLDITNGLYDTTYANSLSLMSFEAQVASLDRKGNFVALNFLKNTIRTPIVCALKLKSSFNGNSQLQLYEDFFLRENKLYLLPNFILTGNHVSNTLHAFDIKIDDKRLESNWGVMYNVELGVLLPRFEYREVLRGYDQAFSEPTTIKNIKEAIRTVTNWGRFELEDYKSLSLSETRRRLYDNFILSPSQFIVSIPEEIISDRVRISLLANLLEQLKEPQTNFVMFYDIERIDDNADLEDEDEQFCKTHATDTQENQDSKETNIRHLAEDFMFTQEQDIYYDNHIRYDFNSSYDLQPRSAFDGAGNFDDSSFDATYVPSTDDYLVYERTFPEIPRLSSATATGRNVEVVCRPNSDGTETFELYGATSESGPYTLLSSTINDTGLGQIVMDYDAILTGNTYYKIKAKAGSIDSMFTLPLHVTLS
jgi:hypothetical protein